MTFSTLPLCYCTNVHPGRTLTEVELGIEEYAAPVQAGFRNPLAIGLWFSDSVSRELAESPDSVVRLLDRLARHGLTCHTLNAFPFGDFHSDRVKERVYQPDWASAERREYTLRCADLLAALMPDGREGSISTLPLGFAPAGGPASFRDACIVNLIAVARGLDELHSETGRIIRLAIEPEPFCQIERTVEAIEFFEQLRSAAENAGCRALVDQHLGLCYDVCHQAVEFEDAGDSIAALNQANVRINKVQISCALELSEPESNREGREALAAYVEPRYLHQTFARRPDGTLARVPDLTRGLCFDPPAEFRNAELWRIHFHVPVNEAAIGPLETTRPQLEAALRAVDSLDYAPHLEVETYTWGVLPQGGRPPIVDGISRELEATRSILADL